MTMMMIIDNETKDPLVYCCTLVYVSLLLSVHFSVVLFVQLFFSCLSVINFHLFSFYILLNLCTALWLALFAFIICISIDIITNSAICYHNIIYLPCYNIFIINFIVSIKQISHNHSINESSFFPHHPSIFCHRLSCT